LLLQDILADLSSPATKGKVDRDQRESLMASSKKNDRLSKIEKAKELENQDFIDSNSPQVVSFFLSSFFFSALSFNFPSFRLKKIIDIA
jgi:hypothetical protein